MEPAIQDAGALSVESVAAAALAGGAVLELNYIGSSSANLFSTVESNYAIYTPGQSTIANTQARRLYPQFGQINNTPARSAPTTTRCR